MLDDTGAWVELGSYPRDEIAVRFHHRLVLIHPFPNGNGRHARARYIEALRAADRHDIAPLLAFARV